MFRGQSIAVATVRPMSMFARAIANEKLKSMSSYYVFNEPKDCENFDCCEIGRDSTAWLVQVRKDWLLLVFGLDNLSRLQLLRVDDVSG